MSKTIAFLWTKQKFDQLVREHALILKRLDELETICKTILGAVKSPSSFGFAVGQVKNKTKENNMLEINITNEQQVKVTLKPVTATGKPAPVDGVPTWEVISGSSTVNAAADGMSADLVSADDPGDTEVLVKADADLGEGVTEISDIVRLHVAGAQAESLGLVAGDPTPKA